MVKKLKNRVLGVITARGKSKGVRRKNIRLVGGKPLIQWTIEAALSSNQLDNVILSSEDDEIIKLAKKIGCNVPFKRPLELATDKVPTIEVILHALELLPDYDYIVVLQPTSPLRIAEDIDFCVSRCLNEGFNSCCSVSKVNKHPNWMYKMNEVGLLSKYSNNNLALRRQDQTELYVPNGAVYVVDVNFLRSEKSFLAPGTVGVVMPEYRSVDIDTEFDLEICNYLLK